MAEPIDDADSVHTRKIERACLILSHMPELAGYLRSDSEATLDTQLGGLARCGRRRALVDWRPAVANWLIYWSQGEVWQALIQARRLLYLAVEESQFESAEPPTGAVLRSIAALDSAVPVSARVDAVPGGQTSVSIQLPKVLDASDAEALASVMPDNKPWSRQVRIVLVNEETGEAISPQECVVEWDLLQGTQLAVNLSAELPSACRLLVSDSHGLLGCCDLGKG